MIHFSVQIFDHNPTNNDLITIIGNNNSGKALVTLDDIIGYLKTIKALYPITHKNLSFIVMEKDGALPKTLNISYQENNYAITISEHHLLEEKSNAREIRDLTSEEAEQLMNFLNQNQ